MSRELRAFLVYVTLLGVFALATFCAITPVHGEGWPTNYQQFNNIRATVRGLPKWTHICFTLNSGELVFGEFLKYESYTDYIWYQPQNTGHNWFKQDAFEVHEIFRVDVVTQEPI